MIELNQLLKMAVNKRASDIHITAGRAPSFRINGHMVQQDMEKLTFEDTLNYAQSFLDKERMDHLTKVG